MGNSTDRYPFPYAHADLEGQASCSGQGNRPTAVGLCECTESLLLGPGSGISAFVRHRIRCTRGQDAGFCPSDFSPVQWGAKLWSWSDKPAVWIKQAKKKNVRHVRHDCLSLSNFFIIVFVYRSRNNADNIFFHTAALKQKFTVATFLLNNILIYMFQNIQEELQLLELEFILVGSCRK